MPRKDDAVVTRIGQAIGERMDEKNIAIRELAVKSGVTYEHIRSIKRGYIVPSARVLKDICAVLKVKYEDWEKLMIEDKIKMKYGEIPTSISKKNPELSPIEMVWDRLSEAHKSDLIAMAQMYYKRDREQERVAS